MRNLVTIQKVVNIESIPNADNIEVLQILGWKVVSKKGNFKVGDLCVYFEVDSIVPRKPWSEFLFTGSNVGKQEYRIRTIKLRKQISQGLCLPLDILPVPQNYNGGVQEWQEGEDITDILEVKKYEPYIPACLRGRIKGNFPNFIPKTDETRIQSVPKVLENNKGKTFFVTEKLDGSSCTFYYKDKKFGVCSRNLELQSESYSIFTKILNFILRKKIPNDTNNVFCKMSKQLKIEETLKSYNKNIAIQGELYGQGIQGNKYKLKGLHFSCFNIYDIDKKEYLSYNTFIATAKELNLNIVPIVNDNFILNHSVDDLVNLAINTKSQINKDTLIEGLVFRPLIEEKENKLGRLSFKVINPEFLIKNKE